MWADLEIDFQPEPIKPKKHAFQNITNPLTIDSKRSFVEKVIESKDDLFKKEPIKKIPIEENNENGLHEDIMLANNAYMELFEESQKQLAKKKEALKDSDSEAETVRKKALTRESKKKSLILKTLRKKTEPYVKKRYTDVNENFNQNGTLEESEMVRNSKDFLRQFPEVKKEETSSSSSSSTIMTQPEPLSTKKFYEEILNTKTIEPNPYQSGPETFIQTLSNKVRMNEDSSLIHTFIKENTPKINIKGDSSIDEDHIDIPLRERDEEEAYLRTPITNIKFPERPCCKVDQCEGRNIPGCIPVTLVEFLTVKEKALSIEGKFPEKQKMCVMCSRDCIGYHHTNSISQGKNNKGNWLIQNYYNDTTEYRLEDCILGRSKNPAGLLLPVVAHIKYKYKQEVRGDVTYYIQQYKRPPTQVFQ
jgi:hypothetical protein